MPRNLNTDCFFKKQISNVNKIFVGQVNSTLNIPFCRENHEYLVYLIKINRPFMNKIMYDIEKRPIFWS